MVLFVIAPALCDAERSTGEPGKARPTRGGERTVNRIRRIMKRLQPEGSHPGLSDQRDSTFRLHLVLLTAHFLMTRFNDLMKAA
jgi:hypothetical protein